MFVFVLDLLRRCSGTGLHLALTGEPRGFSRGVAGFSNYDGEFRMPLVLAQGVKVKVAQSCPSSFDPMDDPVHGILQARILE